MLGNFPACLHLPQGLSAVLDHKKSGRDTSVAYDVMDGGLNLSTDDITMISTYS